MARRLRPRRSKLSQRGPSNPNAGRGQNGAPLTSSAPEAAPDAAFAGDAATLKSEQVPQRWSRLHWSVASCSPPIFESHHHAVAGDRTKLTMVSRKLGVRWAAMLSARLLRRPALRSSKVFELCEHLQSCPGSEPLQRHLDIKRSLLKRTGRVRPVHASASEGVELSDRRRREKFASYFMTYVIQLDITHVLPLRLPTPRRFCLPPMFYLSISPSSQG